MIVTGQEVGVTIDGREVVSGASLVCPAGTMTALIGPSGSGKTTLLHCLGLLLSPTHGRILLDGEDTTGWSSRQRRRFWRLRSAFVLQDYGVMEEESVAFNVTMASGLLGARSDQRGLGLALEQTGLTGRDRELAAHLSGGERQRLSIARAVYKDAQVVLVDEPTASLDAANRTVVIELFQALARRGCTVIVATHDAEMMTACSSQFELAHWELASGVTAEPRPATAAGGALPDSHRAEHLSDVTWTSMRTNVSGQL